MSGFRDCVHGAWQIHRNCRVTLKTPYINMPCKKSLKPSYSLHSQAALFLTSRPSMNCWHLKTERHTELTAAVSEPGCLRFHSPASLSAVGASNRASGPGPGEAKSGKSGHKTPEDHTDHTTTVELVTACLQNCRESLRLAVLFTWQGRRGLPHGFKREKSSTKGRLKICENPCVCTAFTLLLILLQSGLPEASR